MRTLFLLPITLICLICLSYIHTAETDEYDFDLLVFTQQWPATSCKEWKKRDHSHTCSMPPKADSWTIHGIWPTKLGQMGPAFCNRTWLFDPEQVKPIEDQLERVWVNIFAGTSLYSLWSHEWTKHGTCAAILDKLNSEFKYFSMGLKWLGQYSMSNILQSKNILPSNTQKYSIEDINNAIKEKLGVNPEIECKREDGESFISEIRICLTKDFEPIDCNGVLGPKVSVPTVLTNCDKHKDITYPHYISNSWITQLQRFIYWLQWFTF